MIDIIDLDALDSLPITFIQGNVGKEKRALTIAIFVQYCRGQIKPDEFRTLRVWIGLLPAILPLKQRISTDLALAVATTMSNEYKDSNDSSFLVGACIMCSEIMRVFTLEEQDIILKELRG